MIKCLNRIFLIAALKIVGTSDMKPPDVLFSLLTSICLADTNWPQFLGEEGLGMGTGKPPVEFSAEKNLKWQVEVPHGHSLPCIRADKIFLTYYQV